MTLIPLNIIMATQNKTDTANAMSVYLIMLNLFLQSQVQGAKQFASFDELFDFKALNIFIPYTPLENILL